MASPSIWMTLRMEGAPIRVDRWLSLQITGLSRREAARMADAGTLLVNGRPVPKRRLLLSGDEISVCAVPRLTGWSVTPCADAPLEVLYADSEMCIVNKPSGVSSTASGPGDERALACSIAAQFPECATVGRPGDGGLVHRLDHGTSGLLIVARTQAVHARLCRMQTQGCITKRYAALVRGSLNPPRFIEAALAGAGVGRQRVTLSVTGRTAQTLIDSESGHSPFFLVEARIHQGFRHQIRVHLASVGHPICGDASYGGPTLPGLNRLFLHARSVQFDHPVNGKPIAIECSLPDDLRRVLSSLSVDVTGANDGEDTDSQ